MNKAVFIDRDGTINIENDYIYKIKDFEFLPDVIPALKVLQDEGYKLIIITNQSGIARGYYTEEDFHVLNSWMLSELSAHGIIISAVYYCPHHPEAKVDQYKRDCSCRKPKIGMFEQAIKDFDIDLKHSYAIGDKIRDCAICETTDCQGYLISSNEQQEIIDAVKIGEYTRIKYAMSLYEAAIDIKHNGI